MTTEIEKLHRVWSATQNKAVEETNLPKIEFDNLTSSIISQGPFYYYVVDFFDMSLSNVSASIADIHGFDPKTVTFNDVLSVIHPEDVDFVGKAETSVADFFYNNLGKEKLLQYKMNYSFRARMKDGNYVLMNHQALVLTLDSNGGYGKSLNIHTRIDHLSDTNSYKFSLISLYSGPSYLNIPLGAPKGELFGFSKREKEIIKLIADGLDNNDIAEKLSISVLTVKKHRSNTLAKSGCKNTAQLVKTCVMQGLI